MFYDGFHMLSVNPLNYLLIPQTNRVPLKNKDLTSMTVTNQILIGHDWYTVIVPTANLYLLKWGDPT